MYSRETICDFLEDEFFLFTIRGLDWYYKKSYKANQSPKSICDELNWTTIICNLSFKHTIMYLYFPCVCERRKRERERHSWTFSNEDCSMTSIRCVFSMWFALIAGYVHLLYINSTKLFCLLRSSCYS